MPEASYAPIPRKKLARKSSEVSIKCPRCGVINKVIRGRKFTCINCGLDPEASMGPAAINPLLDHGLLLGLADDDHTQYALADKTRPAVWVEAADLAARSIADLGTRTHSLLTGIGPDDHHPRAHDHSNALDGSPIAVAGVPDLPASKITSGRFPLSRMPDGATTGQVLTAQGTGVDPAWTDPLTAADVWGYATRTLTSQAFPFTNPAAAVDLANVRLDGVRNASNPASEVPVNNLRTGMYRGARTAGQATGLNLNGGVGTSGEAGADVVTIGTAGVINIIQSLIVRIGGCTTGATVTVKLFKDVNGTERKVYTINLTVGTDEDSPWIVDSPLFAYGQVRVEMYSNNAADTNVTVAYEYILG